MANNIEIKIPDIGGADKVDVIEILVKVGDNISVDTPLVTLESDKASMDIPSTDEGVVSEIKLKVGDKVSEGDLILIARTDKKAEQPKEPDINKEEETKEASTELKQAEKKSQASSETLDIKIPDIGGATNVDVIDVLVSVGDEVEVDQALVTLEGDKATMDIPASHAGKVKSIKLKVGDKVSQGSLILSLEVTSTETETKEDKTPETNNEASSKEVSKKEEIKDIPPRQTSSNDDEQSLHLFAGPAVRRLAREFGISLSDVKGSGRKERITKEDLQAFVKARLATTNTASGFSLPKAPTIDFSQFGEVDTKPLNKIKKLTGANVHRSWITIPHVTQFDEADITALEAFRKSESATIKDGSYKLTLLAFVCKVVSKALEVYPQFNASLDASGENLIYKKYCNVGIAVETPNGLVVPVIKQVNKLSINDIAKEMGRLSSKAREKGLMPTDMSGGCFTISSLGGIGGTAFTPIVNSPEVAILGLSRSSIKPIYDGKDFKPRLMLPLSLSYDHRVIDGAEAARFTRYIADCLQDVRKILL